MKKNKFLLVYIIALIVIAVTGTWIILKSHSNISVNYLKRDDFASSPSGVFKFFYEPKPNTVQVDPVAEFHAEYSINKDTLNERYDYNPEKEHKVYRIITLGDSFTFGWHVSTKDNWTELLEDMLNNTKCSNISRFEVINLGVSGYDRAYATQRFITRGVKYSPDLVIWFDFEPYRNTEKMEEIFSEYIKKNPAGKPPADFKGKIQNELIQKTSDEKLQKNLISTTETFTKYYPGQLLLLALPYMKSPQKTGLKKIASLRPHTYFFDGLPDIHKNNLTLKNDGHPSIAGHTILARGIYDYLLKSKLIECGK